MGSANNILRRQPSPYGQFRRMALLSSRGQTIGQRSQRTAGPNQNLDCRQTSVHDNHGASILGLPILWQYQSRTNTFFNGSSLFFDQGVDNLVNSKHYACQFTHSNGPATVSFASNTNSSKNEPSFRRFGGPLTGSITLGRSGAARFTMFGSRPVLATSIVPSGSSLVLSQGPTSV